MMIQYWMYRVLRGEKMSEKEVTKMVCQQITECIENIHPSYLRFDKNKEYIDFVKLAILVDELLEIDEYEKRLTESINEDGFGKMRVDTFKLIRNVLIHFPFWDNWEETKISNNILNWNKPKGKFIEKYFERYNYKKTNKSMKYEIYEKEESKWEVRAKIDIQLPTLDNEVFIGKIFNMKIVFYLFLMVKPLIREIEKELNKQ